MSVERSFLNSHPYKIEKLWDVAKKKPIILIPLKTLDISHKKRHWTCKLGHPISAFEVLQNPSRAPLHVQKTEKADLAYPIILAASNLDILDGLHRLNKSIILGKTNIKAQLVSLNDLKEAQLHE